MRTLEAMRPKRFTKFINEDLSAAKDFIIPGTVSAQSKFNNFILGCVLLLSSTLQLTLCREQRGQLQVNDHN